MTPALLVAVAHGLDLVTFMWALSLYDISGETTLMQLVYVGGGMATVILLKTTGTAALALITHMRRWALLPAAGAGLAGATVNLIAISL